eukprot:TRINITY_DN6818_c0_g1_i1.p1 TRINITY_DN6818_c0_g1~~TRINITY_DN6818_c0_g1_i1.p1  ORF type:complete len:196 (+),score=7.87 TRINITY_DN6818_c0_g1_i1:22-588(+)
MKEARKPHTNLMQHWKFKPQHSKSNEDPARRNFNSDLKVTRRKKRGSEALPIEPYICHWKLRSKRAKSQSVENTTTSRKEINRSNIINNSTLEHIPRSKTGCSSSLSDIYTQSNDDIQILGSKHDKCAGLRSTHHDECKHHNFDIQWAKKRILHPNEYDDCTFLHSNNGSNKMSILNLISLNPSQISL